MTRYTNPIAAILAATGWSRARLARQTDQPPQTVSRWGRGDRDIQALTLQSIVGHLAGDVVLHLDRRGWWAGPSDAAAKMALDRMARAELVLAERAEMMERDLSLLAAVAWGERDLEGADAELHSDVAREVLAGLR